MVVAARAPPPSPAPSGRGARGCGGSRAPGRAAIFAPVHPDAPLDPDGARAAAPSDDPPRWVAALALLAALVLVVSPFLDWIEIAPAEAVRHGEALRAAARAEGGGARGATWEELGSRVAGRHALSGLDLVAWSRAARGRLEDPAAESAGDAGPLLRGWRALSALLLGMAGAALLVAVYLGVHRLRRFRSPLLVLAGTTGVVALAFAGGVDWLCRPVAEALHAGPGQRALLAGGAGLLGALVASLTARSALRVLGGTAVTVGGLVGLTWLWVAYGAPA